MHSDWKESKSSWLLWSRSALPVSIRKGNSLAVKWLSELIAKERKKVEDALARNQERKIGSIEGAAKE